MILIKTALVYNKSNTCTLHFDKSCKFLSVLFNQKVSPTERPEHIHSNQRVSFQHGPIHFLIQMTTADTVMIIRVQKTMTPLPVPGL